MKGFIAQCLDAVTKFDSSRLVRPLVFVFTASEGVGCLGAEKVAPAEADARRDAGAAPGVDS